MDTSKALQLNHDMWSIMEFYQHQPMALKAIEECRKMLTGGVLVDPPAHRPEVAVDDAASSLVRLIIAYCKGITYHTKERSRDHVFKSVVAEVGELAEEIAIANGESYKEKGPDGILGESLDVIISAVDQIFVEYPDITEEQLTFMALKKLDKWADKSIQHFTKHK